MTILTYQFEDGFETRIYREALAHGDKFKRVYKEYSNFTDITKLPDANSREVSNKMTKVEKFDNRL